MEMDGDRWLEVRKAIEGRFTGPYYLGFENAFYEGVEWADTHPIKKEEIMNIEGYDRN